MALFGEKYGDEVRVVSVGDWARELCGGTHTGSSGQLGVIKLLGESSIGSGVRRVEALVGTDAYRFLAREHVLVAQLAEALKARPEELPPGSPTSSTGCGRRRRRSRGSGVGTAAGRGGELAAAAADVAGVQVVAHRVDGAGAGDVRKLALDVRGRIAGARCGRGGRHGRRQGVRGRRGQRRGPRAGLSANELVRTVGPLVGGKGGGKDDVAQGGGSDASRIDEALQAVTAAVAASASG